LLRYLKRNTSTYFHSVYYKVDLSPNKEVSIQCFKTSFGVKIDLLITGIGCMQTAYHTGRLLAYKTYDVAYNIGVAGSFTDRLALGDVVNITEQQLGDLGAEDRSYFIDSHELGLADKNEFPYSNGKLVNPTESYFEEVEALPKVSAITVNKVHGTNNRIKLVKRKYHPDVECMEGAAFFYSCLMDKVPFHEIRAISNYVEPRNKDNWEMKKAIDALTDYAIMLVKKHQQPPITQLP